jgi:hypothetical protein
MTSFDSEHHSTLSSFNGWWNSSLPIGYHAEDIEDLFAATNDPNDILFNCNSQAKAMREIRRRREERKASGK